MKKIIPAFLVLAILLSSCAVQKPQGLVLAAKTTMLDKPEFAPAHVGISIYDPAEKKYLYQYQDNKYFVPASNTKLLTCYAAFKNLKDSLVAFEYVQGEDNMAVRFTGDPSFLHPDFKEQKAFDFLQANAPNITFITPRYTASAFGNGWAWNDFDADYMPERSAMPIYGNVVKFERKGNGLSVIPKSFKDSLNIFSTMADGNFTINRDIHTNHFEVVKSNRPFSGTEIPFTVKKGIEEVSLNLLEDTLNRVLHFANGINSTNGTWKKFYSQPTDSLLKIMMHRSDNFFAEQTLLMVANEKIGLMNDGLIIDALLKSEFAGMPQKPRWVDGSGLSRYNLITPQDMVWVLTQMKNEVAWDRIKAILPTGDDGTLGGLYKNYIGKIYAKTGTLTSHVALSGYLITNKGKELIFSVMVNAHQSSAATIRKSIESFLTSIIDQQ
ncbi:MAG: D-alanyl-D-alanine carboxypeptidase [Sediminibacterium sp.]|nr:MAG: D-alanyl-D-alanine carboxypeptidase [Chitinophagaceae bacterium]MDP1844660.1 D-alanyl-D-alanine carboxypeptidase [Sediminibacterium sp.]